MKRRLSVAFLLLIGTFTYALAANRQVEGVVISSEDNLPLIGASVYVTADDLKKVGNNQSTIGVITNIDGQFSISIPEGVTRFYCSYVGYDVLEVKLIPGKNKYDITLQPSAHMLDAVVVTGYQTVERRKLTAAVSKIDISDQMMGCNQEYRPSIGRTDCRTFRKQHFRYSGCSCQNPYSRYILPEWYARPFVGAGRYSIGRNEHSQYGSIERHR